MNKHERKKADTLSEKVRAWVLAKADVVERQDYLELFIRNEKLITKLYTQEMRYEELRKAYHELQIEHGNSCPRIPLMCTTHYTTNPVVMTDTVTVRWRPDSVQMARAYFREDLQRYNPEMFPRMAQAFKHFFHEKIVPALWEQTERHIQHLARSGAQR